MLFPSRPIANIDHTKPLQDSCWSVLNTLLPSPAVSKAISRLVSSYERYCQFVHWMAHQFVGPLTHLFVRLVHQFVGSSVCRSITLLVFQFSLSVHWLVGPLILDHLSMHALTLTPSLTRDCIVCQPSFVHDDTFFLRSLLRGVLNYLVFICRINMDSRGIHLSNIFSVLSLCHYLLYLFVFNSNSIYSYLSIRNCPMV